MSDNSTRHFVAFIITLIALLAYLGGYFSAGFGWWWAGFAVLIVYGGIFNALK
ncbi:MAG: hypothetical protein NTW66_02560 [Candidatus Magasanikbacteria bacterium]|nr:hypothetical protein [Candidatus Magasanikbacteria bacterium]